MSKIEAAIIKASRPQGFRGKTDRYLGKVAFDLRRLIVKLQHDFEFDTCRLDLEETSHLAAICVEFAEDIHCDLGLWKSLEFWNREFFQTPLPFLIETNSASGDDLERFDSRRIQHLIWRMIQFFKDGEDQCLVIYPNHNDLETLAVEIGQFLQAQFKTMPTDSSIGQLLTDENNEAYQVKRKLVWLGSQSYMFRYLFSEYYLQNSTRDHQRDYSVIDDFICQECTVWSGLGPLEILAEVLQLEASDREDLLSWNHRYLAVYEALQVEIKGSNIEVLHTRNVINDQEYVIHMGSPLTEGFEKGHYVLGAIIRWRGKWSWSGIQAPLGDSLSSDDLENIQAEFFREKPRITYRYCPDRAEIAKKHAAKAHADFVDFYGSEMAVFEDGHAMAKSEQERISRGREQLTKKELEKLQKKGGSSSTTLEVNYPQYLLDDTSVAIFSDPIENCTIFSRLDQVEAWLTGQSNDPDRLNAMLSCTETPPAAIRYLVNKHGGEGVAKMLKLEGHPQDLVIEYTLRSLKGEFFRKRYPNIAVVS